MFERSTPVLEPGFVDERIVVSRTSHQCRAIYIAFGIDQDIVQSADGITEENEVEPGTPLYAGKNFVKNTAVKVAISILPQIKRWSVGLEVNKDRLRPLPIRRRQSENHSIGAIL